MRIINTCDEIRSTFSDVFDINTWRRYAEKISRELPSKCENDAKKYNFENDINPVIKNALNDEKIDFVAARILKRYRRAFEELAK